MNEINCSICSVNKDSDEDFIHGEFGIMKVYFCSFCFACVEDMFEKYKGI